MNICYIDIDAETIKTAILLISALISLVSALIAFSAYKLNRENIQIERRIKAPNLHGEIRNVEVAEIQPEPDGQIFSRLKYSVYLENLGERPADSVTFECTMVSPKHKFYRQKKNANQILKGKSVDSDYYEITPHRFYETPETFFILLRIEYYDKILPSAKESSVYVYKFGAALGKPKVHAATFEEAKQTLQKLYPVNWDQLYSDVEKLNPMYWLRRGIAKIFYR